ncbi:MAG: 3-dehydroquinate synthase [Clostridia bacterium]|nr:3-dehydroquinate synthase [Clostridia bacterium]
MRRLTVDLGERGYDIVIGRGLIGDVARHFECRGSKVLLVSDTNVAPLYADKVRSSIIGRGLEVKLVTVPAGEKSKCADTLLSLYSEALAFNMTRSDAIVALGGGVVGDLSGFAAATYMRGIDFIQIPTSLLAQVDSSVGGKVGIDLPEGKNLVGAFHQPRAVIIDPDTLDTLTDGFFADGMGEVIKYGCIVDAQLFDKLGAIGGRDGFSECAEEIIARCCDIKRDIVERDEKESGCRKLLNFGHTYGHALEKISGYSAYSHGQAVAIGMTYITRLSERDGYTEQGCANKIARLCTMYNLPTQCSAAGDEIVKAITADKKGTLGGVDAVFLKKIGDSFTRRVPFDYFNAEGGK